MMKSTFTFLIPMVGSLCGAFTIGSPTLTRPSIALRMGWFDGIAKAFSNEEVSIVFVARKSCCVLHLYVITTTAYPLPP